MVEKNNNPNEPMNQIDFHEMAKLLEDKEEDVLRHYQQPSETGLNELEADESDGD